MIAWPRRWRVARRWQRTSPRWREHPRSADVALASHSSIAKSGQGRDAPLIDDCLAKAWESAKEMAKDKSKVKETSLIRYLNEARAELAGNPRRHPFYG